MQIRYNNNVCYQIDENPKLDLLKVQIFKFKACNTQPSTHGFPQDDSSSWLYKSSIYLLGNQTLSLLNNSWILRIGKKNNYFKPFSINFLSSTCSLIVCTWSSSLLWISTVLDISHWFYMVLVFRGAMLPILKFPLIFYHLALLFIVSKNSFRHRH